MPGVKRWAPWFLMAVGLCFVLFAGRSSSPMLLQDTDTATLLRALRAEDDPLAWFTQDWPLQNHFYRPISTLSFYVDDVVSRDEGARSAATFGRTNALLACCCVLLMFWLVRELTDVPWMTGVATLLFGLWHFNGDLLRLVQSGLAWLGPLCLLGLLRGGRAKIGDCLLAFLGCSFFATQLGPVSEFSGRIVHWLPGRTASVMTVFALASLAMYARSIRRSSIVVPSSATAEDLPATKSSTVSGLGAAWPWIVGAGVCMALAFGSYEQAVMLPALAVGVWVFFRVRGMRGTWWPHVVFWLLLVGYLAVRSRYVPSDVSGYQAQQLRTGPGVWIVLGEYLAPALYWTYSSVASFGGAFLLLLTSEFWSPVLAIAGNVATYFRAWNERTRWWFFSFLLLSALAFLPMAWLQPFGHYHYLPSVFRAVYVVLLGTAVWRMVLSAASLPELQAPSRPCPAPGSLLRP